MIRIAFALSLATNVTLAVWLVSTLNGCATLSAWACQHGNGGHECGEE